MENKRRWTRAPVTTGDADYFFDGQCYISKSVADELSNTEINLIINDLLKQVNTSNGIEFLQIYIASDGRKVYIIDQMSKSMKTSGEFTGKEVQQHNYFNVIFEEEYSPPTSL